MMFINLIEKLEQVGEDKFNVYFSDSSYAENKTLKEIKDFINEMIKG